MSNLAVNAWAVAVRGVDGSIDLYGHFSTREAADRKATAVNKLLPDDSNSEAWAYVEPVFYVVRAQTMAQRATS